MNQQERDSKIQEWIQLKQKLDSVKAFEMELRKEITDYVFGDRATAVESFYEKMNLGNGYGLKATQKLNYKLDEQDRIVVVIDKLTELGKAETASNVFKWKVELSESAYKKLDPEAKALVDEVLSIKIGSPVLEFIEPKAKP